NLRRSTPLPYTTLFRSGAIRQIAVREEDYRRHRANRQAERLDGHRETVRRSRRRDDRDGALPIAPEEHLQQVRLLGFGGKAGARSEEHTSELQSRVDLV